jgi:hypothetical protein
MSVCMLIIVVLMDQYAYDNHFQKNRIIVLKALTV